MNMTTLNTPLPEDLMKLKWNGQFKLMQEMIDLRLQKDIPAKLKERLELEKELISRLPENFTYSKEDAIELLKSKISDFKDEEFDELINAFTVLQNAYKTYRESGNERIKSQIVYWLNCWDDTTNAALNYIKGIKAAQNEEDNATIWDYYSTAQAAFEKSKFPLCGSFRIC